MLRFCHRRLQTAAAATTATAATTPAASRTQHNWNDANAWPALPVALKENAWKTPEYTPAAWIILDDGRFEAHRTFMTDKTTFTMRLIGFAMHMAGVMPATLDNNNSSSKEVEKTGGSDSTDNGGADDNSNNDNKINRINTRMDWHYLKVKFTVPLTPMGYLYAQFLNTIHNNDAHVHKAFAQETPEKLEHIPMRRLKHQFPPGLIEHVSERVGDDFLQMHGDTGRKGTNDFTHVHSLEWFQRAEYLVRRRSRERRELTDYTLNDLHVQHRTRRKLRAEEREKKQKAKMHIAKQVVKKMDVEDAENDAPMVAASLVEDVVPRELRDQLMKESEDRDPTQEHAGRVGRSFTSRYNHGMSSL